MTYKECGVLSYYGEWNGATQRPLSGLMAYCRPTLRRVFGLSLQLHGTQYSTLYINRVLITVYFPELVDPRHDLQATIVRNVLNLSHTHSARKCFSTLVVQWEFLCISHLVFRCYMLQQTHRLWLEHLSDKNYKCIFPLTKG